MEDEAKLAMLRQTLFMLREGRIRPGLDDKVLADWNGLMIAALANAGAMLDQPDWIKQADRALDFIAQSMTRRDRLCHSSRDRRLLDGVLSSAADTLLSHAALLNALDLRLNAAEIVTTGPDHARFAAAALRLPYLNRIMLYAPSAAALPAGHPAQAKIAAGAGSAAVICVGEAWSLPVTAPTKIAGVVATERPPES